jgi:hypothetical protein
VLTLFDVERAVRAAWDAATCDPDDLPWDPAVPERGQCGPTALVLQDLLGGRLLLAEVTVAGEPRGFHWWNLLPSGLQVDLTRDQFRPDEEVGPPEEVVRPEGPPVRCREQYELLSARVRAALASG